MCIVCTCIDRGSAGGLAVWSLLKKREVKCKLFWVVFSAEKYVVLRTVHKKNFLKVARHQFLNVSHISKFKRIKYLTLFITLIFSQD